MEDSLFFRVGEVTPVYHRASLHFCACFLMPVSALAFYVSRAYVISLLNENWGREATATCVAPTDDPSLLQPWIAPYLSSHILSENVGLD